MEETWIKVPEEIGNYEVSKTGKIRSLNYRMQGKKHLLKPGKSKDGYLQVVLYHNGIKRGYKVHRLVWEAFNGPIPEGMQVNHINEDKTDNRLENLNLMTQKENINWGTKIERTNKKLRGKLVNRPDQSKQVKQYNLDGTLIAVYPSQQEAARKTGLTRTAISACCRNVAKTHGGYKWSYV